MKIFSFMWILKISFLWILKIKCLNVFSVGIFIKDYKKDSFLPAVPQKCKFFGHLTLFMHVFALFCMLLFDTKLKIFLLSSFLQSLKSKYYV